MYRSILVPLDGSPASEHALPWALSIAQPGGAALHVARVHQTSAPVLVGSEIASDVGLDSAIRASDTAYLERIAEQLSTSAVPVRGALLDGAVTDALLDHARTVSADLLVMTTHGRGAFARFWLGSVADKVMRQATTPTLLVRPRDAGAADLASRPVIRRIVVPLDGSELAERAIEPAIRLGRAAGADYALVLVLDAVDDAANLQRMKIAEDAQATFPEATQAKAEVYLEKVAEGMRAPGAKVETKVIRHGSAASAVLDYAQSHGNAVIALATHGRSGIRRLMLGSVADKVVRGATVPVLVYHPA